RGVVEGAVVEPARAQRPEVLFLEVRRIEREPLGELQQRAQARRGRGLAALRGDVGGEVRRARGGALALARGPDHTAVALDLGTEVRLVGLHSVEALVDARDR